MTRHARVSSLGGGVVSPDTAVIADVVGGDWCLVFWSLGECEVFEAQAISEKLKTDVLEYFSHDTSDTYGLAHHRDGSQLSELITASDAKLMASVSPSAELLDDYGEVFSRLGIELAEVYPSGGQVVVVSGQIARCDLIMRCR